MDQSVLNALKKWPNVPDVFGWLSLDLRENWLIKDSVIENPGISEFIGRNYAVDEHGRWFFQNGPQRVFVSLAYAPFVLRTSGASDPYLVTHTGLRLERISGAWIDEAGTLVVRWPSGLGSVCDRDLAEVADWFTNADGTPVADETLIKRIESPAKHGSAGFWLDYRNEKLPVGRVLSRLLPQKFAFDRSPQPAPGQPDC